MLRLFVLFDGGSWLFAYMDVAALGLVVCFWCACLLWVGLVYVVDWLLFVLLIAVGFWSGAKRLVLVLFVCRLPGSVWLLSGALLSVCCVGLGFGLVMGVCEVRCDSFGFGCLCLLGSVGCCGWLFATLFVYF